MSKKIKTYSSDFKAKAIIELLSFHLTLNKLASRDSVRTTRDYLKSEKVFLSNTNLPFNLETRGGP